MRILLSLALVFVGVGKVWSQEQDALDAVARAYADNGWFMGSVLVTRGDEVLLSKGYGFADLAHHSPDEPATEYRIGSLTKQFTAAAILLLEERGKLRVDDPVRKYLPDFPPAWDKVTIRNVLNHTAGIPNFTSFPDYAVIKKQSATPEQTVARFRDKPLEFLPGEKWNYSNSGYVLLGYLIEKISGQAYADFLRQNVFEPLGMKHSGYDTGATDHPHRAQGYQPGPDGPVAADFIDMSVPFSAGALYSTTGDLLLWERGLFGGQLLSAAAFEKMITPGLHDYGFGLGVGKSGGRKVVAHAGGIEGFSSYLAYFPEEKITLVVLANLTSAPAEAIIHAMDATLHGGTPKLPIKRTAITVPEETLRKYTGAYELNPNFIITITVENGKLCAQPTSQPKLTLRPESENKFFLALADIQLEFTFDPHGNVSGLILHQNGHHQPATKR